MKVVLQSIREGFTDAWMQYHHDVETRGYMCIAVPAKLTAEETAKKIEENKKIYEALGEIYDFPDIIPSPLSLSFDYALDGLTGELLDAGWEVGKMRFEAGESGTRALLDIMRIEGRKLVPLRSRPLRLSGMSRHINYRGIEVAVAALCVMHAARKRARSGR
jgi:hypothetical protein